MSYFIGFYRRGSEGQSGGQLPGRKLHFHIYIFPVVGFTKQQNNETKISSPLIGQFSLIRGFAKRFCIPIGQKSSWFNCKLSL